MMIVGVESRVRPTVRALLKERATVRLLSIETELARRMTRGMNLSALMSSENVYLSIHRERKRRPM